MFPITSWRPVKQRKIGRFFAVLILFGLLLGYDRAVGAVEAGYIQLVARLEIDRFEIEHASDLTTDLASGKLLLFEGDLARMHRISTFGRLQATENLEGLKKDSERFGYDARSERILTYDPRNRQLAATPLQQIRSGAMVMRKEGQAVTIPLKAVHGIAVDPDFGDVYLLDGDSLRLSRVDASVFDESEPSSQSGLEPVSTTVLNRDVHTLRGLAFDPAGGHLFSINPQDNHIIEFTLSGDTVQIFDLSPFNLPQLQALAFAPSTDQTDAPAVTSLYISGGGKNSEIWEFTFAHPPKLSTEPNQSLLVNTIEVWQFSPPSPDASGLVYLPGSGTLLESDSEVNEKTIYEGVNQFEMTLNGSLTHTYDTTHFTEEPTGVAFDPFRSHLFFTDDNLDMIFETDLSYNLLNSLPADFIDDKEIDPEGIAYNTWNGRLYIAGGSSNVIFWIDAGFDTIFGTSDDVEGSFPSEFIFDPEGITFNTDSGNLYVVGIKDYVGEYTAEGSFVQLIDISAPNPIRPAGLAYGPASVGDGKSIYVSDRGVDEDSQINGGLGDGKIYEFKLGPPPAPIANFTGTPESGPAPLTVEFTNFTTSFYDSCKWDFGDGSTGSECHGVTHTYENPGIYTVELSIDGPWGADSKRKKNYIEVEVQAIAEFSGSPRSGLVPVEVTFVNESSGDYDICHWEFGDSGINDSCAAEVSHTYTTGGQFTVRLTVDGIGGTDTESKPAYMTMYSAPTADFSPLPAVGHAPLWVQFVNQSTGDYESCSWDFGDDSGSSDECVNPTHLYTSSGAYTVKLSLDGPYGADTITKIDAVSVGPPVMNLPLVLAD